MANSIQLKMVLCSLFTQSNVMIPRWGAPDSHPISKAEIVIEGTALSTTSGPYGHAQLDVSSLSAKDYTLSLTPDASNALRASGESVGPADGNPKDPMGQCRYRPLKFTLSMKIVDNRLAVASISPGEDMSHGAAFLSPAVLLIDWRPDWVACKNSGSRPDGIEPNLIILHRTEATTPGSSIDSFLRGGDSSHYLVDTDGHVVKLVHESLVANHAGPSFWQGKDFVNGSSVGIEIVNETGSFTSAQYAAISRLIKQLQKTYPGIGRHGVLAHGDVQVRKVTRLESYIKDLDTYKAMKSKDTQSSYKHPTSLHDLTLDSRAGCPGVYFNWPLLEEQGLCSKADASLFPDNDIFKEYGGIFRDNPNTRISVNGVADARILKKDKSPYGVIATLKAELSSLGYSVTETYGAELDGVYDLAIQRALDRFRRRYMPGVVPNNEDLSAVFDRVTAIALKRVLMDRKR